MEKEIRKRIRMQILVLVSSVLLVMVLIFAMTAAWFTNVAKTSDLVFETKTWGFDEEKIALSESRISIAPGTSGIIPLTVDNSGALETVKVTVAISKEGMEPAELQKRIFFYVDTSKTVDFTQGIGGSAVVQESAEGETGAAEAEADGADTAAAGAVEPGDILPQETVSKIYLGMASPCTYTYTILPGQTLTMDETFYSDVPIKWEWVYDMLGYYFRGTVGAAADADSQAEGAGGTDTEASGEISVTIQEYLRPIEYDYELAVFDETAESETYKQLLKVGETETADLLAKIAAEDGYPGTINTAEAVVIEENGVNKLYYPVQTDESGYGIWAYLCNSDEVLAATVYDTELAKAEEAVTAEATILLTAYNVPAQTETVNTEAELAAALADEEIDVVELGMDMSTASPLSFTEGSKVINLNGFNLQYSGTETEYEMFTLSKDAALTVLNGQITGTAAADQTASQISIKAFESAGGNLTLSGVKVEGFDSAVTVSDYTAETVGDSLVQITDSELIGEQIAVFLQGNGLASDAMTKVIIQNSKLVGRYHTAVSGQGNNDRWGTELVLTDSELEGYYGGIFQPQRSSVTTVTNCTITGNTGIILKGGTMHISDSKVYGTGQVAVSDAAISQSGYTDTGDGVYVEAAYNWSASLILRGANEVISDQAYGVEMIGAQKKGPGRIMIYSGTDTAGNVTTGTYTGAKGSANWNEIGTFEIYGGQFPGEVHETIARYDVETGEN